MIKVTMPRIHFSSKYNTYVCTGEKGTYIGRGNTPELAYEQYRIMNGYLHPDRFNLGA